MCLQHRRPPGARATSWSTSQGPQGSACSLPWCLWPGLADPCKLRTGFRSTCTKGRSCPSVRPRPLELMPAWTLRIHQQKPSCGRRLRPGERPGDLAHRASPGHRARLPGPTDPARTRQVPVTPHPCAQQRSSGVQQLPPPDPGSHWAQAFSLERSVIVPEPLPALPPAPGPGAAKAVS